MDQEISRPVIGITLGDFNGIGPEVIIKTFEVQWIKQQKSGTQKQENANIH